MRVNESNILSDIGASLALGFVTLMSGCASLQSDKQEPLPPGAIALFDGKSLSGWHRLGGDAEFRIENGCIVGATRPNQANSFLCTVAEYDNFILELDFKVDPQLNSGIQIRSESRVEYQNGRVHGYQIEIDPSDRAWTGGIYDESRRGWLVNLKNNPAAQAVFHQNKWNHFRIEANGDLIRTELNGVPAAELHDSMTLKGFIGLQVHAVGARRETLEVRWKNITLRSIQ
jgi:hypothetical protein